MLQPDRLEGVTGDRIATAEGLVPDPYVQEFEERFAVLQPLYDYQTPGVKFDMGKVGLQPDKFTAAIFLNREESFEILLGKKKMSGYFQEDHWPIADEHGQFQNYYSSIARPAFIASMHDQRFVIVSMLSLWSEDDEKKLRDTLKRYGIAMAFSSEPDGEIIPILDDLGQGTLSSDQYMQAIDKVIYDGLTSQVAKRYGLTNTELLRLRILGELPQDKQKPA